MCYTALFLKSPEKLLAYLHTACGLLPLVCMDCTIKAQWAEVTGNRDAKFESFFDCFFARNRATLTRFQLQGPILQNGAFLGLAIYPCIFFSLLF